MTFYTADLCDDNEEAIEIAAPIFRSYGRATTFGGEIETLRVYEDNSLVKAAVSTKVNGHVLVVDGGASVNCALLGGNLAELAAANGWAGLIINGCIRDVHEINESDIGIRALASCPRKSEKRGQGESGVLVKFAAVKFQPGAYVYADLDGVIVSPQALT